MSEVKDTLGCWIRLAALLVGAGITISGCDELSISTGVGAEPEPVDLGALEQGAEPPSGWIELGSHLRIFDQSMVTYLDSQTEAGEPTARTPVMSIYYPIVSLEHPFARGDQELTTFAVLVDDSNYERFGKLPDNTLEARSIRGMVVTSITRWREGQEQKLQQLYPSIDLDHVIVLEKDRVPESTGAGILRMALGMALLVFGTLGARLLRLLGLARWRRPEQEIA